MARTNKQVQDPVVRQLDGIKRLLVLLLIKSGASQKEIALALDMDQADISRMFPSRKIKKFGAPET